LNQVVEPTDYRNWLKLGQDAISMEDDVAMKVYP
jgi:hypothetical protein